MLRTLREREKLDGPLARFVVVCMHVHLNQAHGFHSWAGSNSCIHAFVNVS